MTLTEGLAWLNQTPSSAGKLTSVAHRRDMARQLGADAVIDPSSTDVVKEIRQGTGNRGVDLAIDCAAKGGSMNHALFATRSAGRVVYTGIPSEMVVPMEFHEMRRKELTIYNVRRSNHESEAALELLRAHPSRFAPIVTHVLPMDRAQAAFEMLETYSDGAGKVVLKP